MQKRYYHPVKPWHIALMCLGVIASFQSWKWSFDILNAMFGDITGILIATMVTIVEIYSLMQLILTHNPAWLLGVIPGFILSVAGSYGNFQMNYEQNVAKSDEYIRKETEILGYESEINTAVNAADQYTTNKQPWYAKRERQRADQIREKKSAAETELKGMTDAGYGSSNALFRSISRHSDLSTLDAAEQGHLALGLCVELFMLLCTALGTSAMKKGYAWVKPNENDYYVGYDDDGTPHYGKNETSSPPRKQPAPIPMQPKAPPRTIPEMAMEEKTKRPIGFQEPVIRDIDVPPVHDQKKTLIGGINSNGNGNDSSHFKEMQKKSLEKQLQLKNQRKNMLKRYLALNPNASLSEMASAIGVSSQATVRKYLEEMGH